MSPANDTLPPSEGDVNLTPRRTAWLADNLDAETQALLDEDATYFLHQSLSSPCMNALGASEGSYLIDTQDRRILDFHGNWVHQVGHGNPQVIEAIIAQLQTLPFSPRRYTNQPAVTLAKRLTQAAPGNLNRVLFAPGGAEAISMAIQLARLATGRHKTISMWDSFHGATLDAISVGGEALFRRGIGPLLPGTEHVPPPYPRTCPWHCGTSCSLHCADYIEYVLEKEGDVAAVLAETVRSVPFIPPPDYWKRVRAACDRHGALLILDEIPTALGRTGTLFACEQYDIVPDMLVLGKGLGGGIMPLAALLARDDLNIAGNRALGHFTHEKSPVACAAALATLDYIKEHQLLEHTCTLGAYALQRLGEMQEQFSFIGDVRGRGLLLGVELIPDPETQTPALEIAESILYAALARGLSFKVTMGTVLTLVPPLTITKDEMDEALHILEACFADFSTGINGRS